MSATDFHSAESRQTERRGFFGRIFDALVMVTESNHRMRKIEELSAMSDDELARRGLRRDEIVRHVFRDRIHI